MKCFFHPKAFIQLSKYSVYKLIVSWAAFSVWLFSRENYRTEWTLEMNRRKVGSPRAMRYSNNPMDLRDHILWFFFVLLTSIALNLSAEAWKTDVSCACNSIYMKTKQNKFISCELHASIHLNLCAHVLINRCASWIVFNIRIQFRVIVSLPVDDKVYSYFAISLTYLCILLIVFFLFHEQLIRCFSVRFFFGRF